jgi:hypothetical protein
MNSKPFWYSKVFWVNFGSFLVVVFGMLADAPDTARYASYFVLAINILNIGLRFLTDQAVTLMPEPKPSKPKRKPKPHEVVVGVPKAPEAQPETTVEPGPDGPVKVENFKS